ncbi:MAG: putative transcriptional regulator [Oleiphilaceae bacterium]|jgi:putative transcriptional regulator
MIKFHPTNQKLNLFSDGLLAPAEALIISAHCDMCPQCFSKVMLYTEAHSEALLEDIPQNFNTDIFGSMMADITSEAVDRGIASEPQNRILELDGRKFTLPSSLNRLSESMGNWSHMVGKLWQAPVSIGGDTVANFIFMEKGGGVPEHTHRGSEMTLVVNGEFSDGLADYSSGDFTVMNGQIIHTPSTASDEGCLVFSVIDAPLHFTSGWARLINPFSHLFFK